MNLLKKHQKKNIWIRSEIGEGEFDPYDENTDVIVTFPNRIRYVASFFTYKNIESIRQQNREHGENMNGLYFWSSDMVIVDNIKAETITSIIEQLITEDKFESLLIEDVSSESDHLYEEGFFDS
ncbi:hypothetical protein P4V86_02380 [Brevibacillus laterosporus]|uniref:hypothetical protein n=1 Tax=Brevibacillus laterosporus TaxID=1465 RepID=UPI00035C2974|nr:hypothetical protein [Brevibacillus laterosporus]ATO48823.1 hypothetical protein BrL25_06720 [Brevibacillus laterosporus DSM 25]MBG9800685.1 hypothetical protein [Brevibacillus laterosporus]MED2002200.1 hypothetical protein [Brevibacillus laterosporus]MED4764891.1 hypothetical protein [Brevibacillus laterosporus]TPH17232.1 hypothetical protein EGH09_09620 [Brevibacillus laterosporus]